MIGLMILMAHIRIRRPNLIVITNIYLLSVTRQNHLSLHLTTPPPTLRSPIPIILITLHTQHPRLPAVPQLVCLLSHLCIHWINHHIHNNSQFLSILTSLNHSILINCLAYLLSLQEKVTVQILHHHHHQPQQYIQAQSVLLPRLLHPRRVH